MVENVFSLQKEGLLLYGYTIDFIFVILMFVLRLFHEGRTETIRPVSEFSAQWVRSMQSERATREQKVILLRKAVQYQTQNKIDASTGYGWDRHLLGLFAMSLELQMAPALFQDKVCFIYYLSFFLK